MRYVPILRWGVGLLAVSMLLLGASSAHAGLGTSLRKATGKAKEKLAQGQAAVDKVDQAANKGENASHKLQALTSTAGAESLLDAELGLSDNTSSSMPSATVPTSPPAGGRAARGTRSGSNGGAASKGAASGGVAAGGPGGATTPAVTPAAAPKGKFQILRVVLLSPVSEGTPAGTDIEWDLGVTMWDNAARKWVAPPASQDLHGMAVVSYGIKANGDMTLATEELSEVKFHGGHKAFNDRGITGECIPGGKVSFSLPNCAVAGVKLELKSEKKVGEGGLGLVTSTRIAESGACGE